MKPKDDHARERPVLMAVIGAAHGVSGEVRVKSFTQDPLSLGDYGPLSAADGRAFTVSSIRPAKTVVVVRFREIGDRTAAEALSGTELFVPRARLPADLEEDEFYYADLVGLEARTPDGVVLGRIVAVHDFGAGEVIEVKGGKGVSMIPFTRVAVPKVALAEGHVLIDPLAAGLLDEDGGEGAS